MSESTPINATTADYIAYHAAERPEAVALINSGRPITYTEFDRDLRKVHRAVAEFGLPRGSSAAVGHDDHYIHWLLLLSLEQLGIVTGSVYKRDRLAGDEMRATVDCLLAAPGFPTRGAPRHIEVSEAWWRGVLASAESADRIPVFPTSEDRIRFLQSSGTTGRPKRVILLRRMLEARVRQFMAQFEFTSHARYLITSGFSVWHVYGVSTACLRAGGTLVADFVEGRLDLPQSVRRHGITHASMLPIHLKKVLDELAPDFIKPPNLTIHSFGAPIAETLRDLALERLAVEVFRNYGCNEAAAGFASRAPRKDGFGSVWPDTAVEIVDEDDRPVPAGTVGHIRLRTPCMVEGYADDPEATRRHFKDGWFYPEDVGVMNQHRQLRVVGRRDEMLNVGGQKVSPADLEEQVLRYAAIADVGACSFPNASGFEEVYFGVSSREDDAAELLRRISAALTGLPLGKFYIVRLPSIPRNANGKILRDKLKEAVAQAAGRTI